MTSLVWLRRDLRIQDHPAIAKALESGETRIIYIATEKQWLKQNESQLSIEFRKRRVNQLAWEFGQKGIIFDTLSGDYDTDIPDLLEGYCNTHKIHSIYFIREYPFYERQRDENVVQKLSNSGINVDVLNADLIVNQPVLTQDYKPYKVFTPYYKKWVQLIEDKNNFKRYQFKYNGIKTSNIKPFSEDTDFDSQLKQWQLKSEGIIDKLYEFSSGKLDTYQSNRDYPAIESTSKLSAYLSFGMLGPRQLLSAIMKKYCTDNDDWKSDFWLRELAWRDFYRQLMFHFPRLSKNKDFNTPVQIKWNTDKTHIKAWKNGLTGYPIIDAGMRQLNTTGWMHNRLRMLTAVFLTKILLIDWRVGEKYFMRNLIDGEFSANNGGWQWSASTGCDAVPYFRIFNPILQSKKFDKEGKFIRNYVPELSNVSDIDIHNPPESIRRKVHYPQPIVDYKTAKENTLKMFKGKYFKKDF